MNVSVRWLRALVPGLAIEADEIAERLSATAVVVDEVVEVGHGLEGLRVARVEEARPHPNADRLTLCRVDAGDGDAVDVVCGAPNVVEGALYPYVPPGATLPGGLAIEARSIRGEESHGMLCSEEELGLGRDAAGILRLDDRLEAGQPLTEALELPDWRLVLDLTPNRVDLACHVGVAREVAPTGTAGIVLPRFGTEWDPEWEVHESRAEAAGVSVEIEDPDRCDRYLGAVVRGVEVGPSPAWLASRLRAIGARPVNNVVDATNYVLHELNQPLHAFDLERLQGRDVRVRAARKGERLTTLDGVDRELVPGMTVIADAEAPVGLAGVMGGEDSEVTRSTTDVFLECASFDPRATRRTAARAELSTDASYRFERGIDRRGLEAALVRCVELVLAVAGGRAAARGLMVGGPRPEPRVVELRPSRVEQVLGRGFGPGELRRLLDPIGFEAWEDVDDRGSAVMACRVPGWRDDVTREIDLVEEVARRHGYEAFPAEDRAFRPSRVPDDPQWLRTRRARDFLVGRGFMEARCSPLVTEEEADPRRPVRLPNPQSEEESHLRGSLVATLLRRLEHNWARGQRDVRLFEVGTTFRREERVEDPGDVIATFGEERRVAAVFTGRRRPEHWEGDVPAFDVWDLRGLCEDVAAELCRAEVSPATGEDDEPLVARFAGSRWTGSERFGLVRSGTPVGIAARVHAEAVDAPPWADAVWGLELRLDAVQVEGHARYREVSEFPAVHRDLALVVPAGEPASAIGRTLRTAAPELLERVWLFDVYEGEEIGADRRSLAFRFRFRAPDRTLEDAEVERAMETITEATREAHDARVRGG